MKAQQNIFVKNNGSNSGKGSFLNPASLKHALKLAAKKDGKKILYLSAGVYQIPETLNFGTELSNVEFRSLSKEKVIFNGGRQIANWQQESIELPAKGKNKVQKVWVANVSELISEFGEFKFLHINGQPKTRCSYLGNTPGLAKKTDCRLSYDFPDSISSCKNTEEWELVLYYDWVCRRLKVKSVDADGLDFVADMTKLSDITRFCIENMPLEFLSPGEWKLDVNENKVYYMPEDDESFKNFTATAAYTPQLLKICGDLDSKNFVENLVFDGIEFCHTGDGRLINSNQAECNCSASVFLSGALNCRFENCTFSNTSGWGIEFADGCRNNIIERCHFKNNGAGAIMANGSEEPDSAAVTGYNRFNNNTITKGGRVWASAVGILLCHSCGNQISGNEISEYYYSGISCGWIWHYGKNISKDNIISNNHIHHLGNDLLADMGGIYTLGVQPGTVITGNVIHDIAGRTLAWGIYLDEGSSNIIIEDNLVYNIKSECFHVNYGRDNLVQNNVFAFGENGICSTTRGTMDMNCNFKSGDKVFVSKQNIMITSGGPFYVKNILDYEIKEDINCIKSDHNVLQFTGKNESILGADGYHYIEHTFQKVFNKQKWQTIGFDKNSFITSETGVLPKVRNIEWLSPSAIKLYKKYYKQKEVLKA